ncbi:MAG TPA: DAK2 domain-containing protein [Candidatus Marinimicrobia bacterium]|nr:DAK2 domain-containing protein [Candidatus Neomarinimicrobiota bacterium]HRS51879.1 DAK2 domain-containing protein [Candidatus Neomarinimicrobiota bacterium]HRU92660.1 DAK2 domain-containing protein [Candidatus Neomarinimicrobiota bacterium]
MELTASDLNRIIKDALTVLSIEKNRINDLNVFPVPDGDTGLNMVLTIQGGLAHAKNFTSDQSSLSEYITALAEGMTLNSRGCSGVILALFAQGVAKKLADCPSDQKIPNTEVAQALISGYKHAYAEISNPKEGTMLTLMRVFAERFSELAMDGKDALSIIKDIVPDLEETLGKTPEMLPVLKKAGVVDSGAMGFLVLIKGLATGLEYTGTRIRPIMNIANVLSTSRFIRSVVKDRKYESGKERKKLIPLNISLNNITNISFANILTLFNNLLQRNNNHKLAEEILEKSDELYQTWNPDIQYRYCTEFVFESDKIGKDSIQKRLESYGDSILIIESGDIYKCHIHTNKPKDLLRSLENLGEISATKIDDMKVQHKNLISEDKEFYERDLAVLLIVNGEGFAKILKSLGATDILVYKQVKPSVHQIGNALFKTRAKNIIVAADDSDILASLKSAITLCKSNVELIETQNVIQMISMMYNFSPEMDILSNANIMRENLDTIKFCRIARATRQFKTDFDTIPKGNYFSIHNKNILAHHSNLTDLIKLSIEKIRENESLITLYRGKMEKNNGSLIAVLQRQFSSCEFEIYYGGQNRYNYYITFE